MTVATRGTEAPPAVVPGNARMDPLRGLRTGVALAVGSLSILPVWRLLDRPGTGLAGAATAAMTSAYSGFLWAGAALLVIPALLAARAVQPGSVDRMARRVSTLLTSRSTSAFAGLVAALAFIAALAFGRFALAGQPNLVDAMTQLLHARFLAGGSLAGPGSEYGAFWMPQQSVFTPHGWVSQYPPGHAALLALGLRAGVPWAIGPAMFGVTAFFTALAAERLLPDGRATARLGALLVALSPFLIAHAGAWMNHTSAAAFGAIAVWCASRSPGGRTRWAIAAGAAVGAMFTIRPLSALTLAAVITLWLGWQRLRQDRGGVGRAASVVPVVLIGALPFGLLVAAYNAYFFGSPTTFGYDAALGPAGALGFGVDPWGNTFGVTQAVAYTSAELTTLSQFLLETPLPLVALIATWLALTPRLEAGERLIAGWALAPLAAQLAYWHHGLFMGPRMLNESAPAWCLLAAIALPWLVAKLPVRLETLGPYSPRVFGATLGVVGLVAGLVALAPMRLASYAQRPAAPAAALSAPTPALVFVHGGWTSRLAARLAASGMRLDSVETALRQNPTCAVQTWLDARGDGALLPTLDFERRATGLPAQVEVSPGNRIRVAPGERLSGECARQAASDRLGTIDVTPLLWLGSVPGRDRAGITIVRDLGPALNGELIRAEPGRTAWVLATRSPDSPPALVPYDEAMRALWGAPEGSL